MALLGVADIALVADIRKLPGSLAYPQFNAAPRCHMLAKSHDRLALYRCTASPSRSA